MKNKICKGVLIDPITRTVQVVQVNMSDFTDLYDLIHTRIVERTEVLGNKMLWLDEEGLLRSPNNEHLFRLTNEGPYFAGPGVILGARTDDLGDEAEKLAHELSQSARYLNANYDWDRLPRINKSLLEEIGWIPNDKK